MAEREIVSIMWHNLGHHIEVVYLEGDPDRIIGAQIVASQLADSVGLALVPSLPGTIRWERGSDSSTVAPEAPPEVNSSSSP